MKRIKEYFGKIFQRIFPSRSKPPVFDDILQDKPAIDSRSTLGSRPGDSHKSVSHQEGHFCEITSRSTSWQPSDFQVPMQEGKTRFHELGLPDEIMHGIFDLGFQYCTPIQAEMLPATLAGRDAFGRAQTGTGKTAAFLITILTRFHRDPDGKIVKPGTPRALVLAPTRELVMQIMKEAEVLSLHSPFRIVAVFGGMDYEKQRRLLTEGTVDMVIATPGRLLDFLRKRQIRLSRVEFLVIDEADRMLDMGFIPDVRRIISNTPQKAQRQTMLFSATLTPEVRKMATQWTHEAVSVEIEPENVAADTVEQIVYITTVDEKFNLLLNYIIRNDLKRVIVFCNRKDETRLLAQKFEQFGMNCAVLSGDIPQRQRIQTLEDFKNGKIRLLVATDVAGRGIHIDGMDHVINYTLPHDPEDYVHRIGRTGRAGASGTSVSFACEDDSFYIPAIEEYMGRSMVCVRPPEELLAPITPPARKKRSRPRRPGSGSNQAGSESPNSESKPRHHRRRRSRNGFSGAAKGKRQAEAVGP